MTDVSFQIKLLEGLLRDVKEKAIRERLLAAKKKLEAQKSA